MNNKTALLTGATGFLGSHVLEQLIVNGYKVLVLKRSTSNLHRINHLHGKYRSLDVDKHNIEEIFKQQPIDFIIHTACNYGRKNSELIDVIEANLIFGIEILEQAILNNVTTFINIDTFLPRNLNAYSLSKKQFVDWLKQKTNEIQIINLKLEHMYGPKDDSGKFIIWLILQLLNNEPEIALTSGVQKRDFIYIDDVVSAILCVIQKQYSLPNFMEYEVGTGDCIKVKDFVIELYNEFESCFGQTKTQLKFGEIEYREGEIMEFYVNNQPLIDLGWYPKISLNKGLQNIVKEFK